MYKLNIITGNKYIDSINKYFELIYDKKLSESNKQSIFKKTTDTELKRTEDNILEIYKELQSTDLDYDGIRKYADFITVLEKAYIYKNDKNINEVVGINPTNSERKTIFIKEENSNVEIQISAFFDYDRREEAVELIIKRYTGREITNKWIVYNGVCDNKLDESDIISMYTMNNYVRFKLSKLYIEFIDLIKDKKLFDFDYRKEEGL